MATDKQKKFITFEKMIDVIVDETGLDTQKCLYLADVLNEISSSDEMVLLTTSLSTRINIRTCLIDVLDTDDLGDIYTFSLLL